MDLLALTEHCAQVRERTHTDRAWHVVKMVQKFGVAAMRDRTIRDSLNLCGYRKRSPLLLACKEDLCSVVKFLLENQADITLQDRAGWTCLMAACEKGCQDCVQAIVGQYSCAINFGSSKRWKSLTFCTSELEHQLALVHTQRSAFLNQRDTNGSSALLIACAKQKSAIALYLISKGASLDLQDHDGYSALMLACVFHLPKVARALLERNAQVDLSAEDGTTALIAACEYDRIDTGKLLIERGAYLDAQKNILEHTALMTACYRNQSELALSLIESEPERCALVSCATLCMSVRLI